MDRVSRVLTLLRMMRGCRVLERVYRIGVTLVLCMVLSRLAPGLAIDVVAQWMKSASRALRRDVSCLVACPALA